MDIKNSQTRLLLVHVVTMGLALLALIAWMAHIQNTVAVNWNAIAASQLEIISLQTGETTQYSEVIERLDRIESTLREQKQK